MDDNSDSVLNDRPSGVERNTVRTRWQYTSCACFTYTIGIGRRTVPLPPGFTFSSSGGAMSLTLFTQPDMPRLRDRNWIGTNFKN